MCANAGVEADALDDMPGIKPLHLGVGVQFIEEGNAEGKIGVGEQLDRLGLGEAHEEGVDILFDSTSYNKIVVFIDRSPAECYNKFRMLWIGGTSPTAKTVFGRLQPQLLC